MDGADIGPGKEIPMAHCAQCGGSARYHVRLMEVRTCQNPQFYEQEPMQVIGPAAELDICADCARRQLRSDLRLLSVKEWLQLMIVVLMAALCFGVYRSGQSAAMLPGAACLILGCACTLREAVLRRRKYLALPEAEELETAAGEVAVSCAEQERGREVIYIPVTAETMKLHSGDLMIGFGLRPEVSEDLWKLMHQPRMNLG